jgi:DNA-binding transcriptional MerR regulator
MTPSTFSAEQLALEVDHWCEQHHVTPASGQAGEKLTERNVRYYRTLGLLDAPLAGAGPGFGEKHRLQLIAVRLLQAQGLPLNRIRELLFGRSLAELRQIEKRGLAELRNGAKLASFRLGGGDETWCVTPLDSEFMIVSRRGRKLPETVREQLRCILSKETTGVDRIPNETGKET